jgi:hypothetical protein
VLHSQKHSQPQQPLLTLLLLLIRYRLLLLLHAFPSGS